MLRILIYRAYKHTYKVLKIKIRFLEDRREGAVNGSQNYYVRVSGVCKKRV